VTSAEQFISSLVHALVWPLVVVALAFTFRRQLAKLVEAPVHRLKAGPFEVEFDRVLATVAENVEGDTAAAGESDLTTELTPLASLAPASAVMEASARLERELREKLQEADIVDPRGGLTRLAREATEHQLITPETANAIKGIAVLRNLAAHGHMEEISTERALEYVNLVAAVLYVLRQPPPDPAGVQLSQ
jgi:hypothetical protein